MGLGRVKPPKWPAAVTEINSTRHSVFRVEEITLPVRRGNRCHRGVSIGARDTAKDPSASALIPPRVPGQKAIIRVPC